MSAGLVGLSAMLVSRCAYVASTSTGASQPLDGVAAPAAGITAAVTSAAAPQARRTAVAFMTSAPLPSLSSPETDNSTPTVQVLLSRWHGSKRAGAGPDAARS